MTEDHLLEALCHQQILRKQDIVARMRALPIPPDQPAALLWALLASPDFGRSPSKPLLAILGERLALEEARRGAGLHYIPCPGYDDARLILPIQNYDGIPGAHQREIAFLLENPKKENLLLVLSMDPWHTLEHEESADFWKKEAAKKNMLGTNADPRPVFGFTQLNEALTCANRRGWETRPQVPNHRGPHRIPSRPSEALNIANHMA